MKKLFKQATVSLITTAFLGSIIPMNTHAEEFSMVNLENTINQVNTQTSLPAPPFVQGKAVNDKYPQMPMPTVEAFSNENGTGTGYLNVSWKPVEGVTKYQVILFNGSIHSYWDVPADKTSWTTKGKGMFPTAEQIDAGQVNFKRDGSGGEFSIDPTYLYEKTFEVNSGGLNYAQSIEYYVRVTAVFEDGSSPISYASTTAIPVEDLTKILTYEELDNLKNYEYAAKAIEQIPDEVVSQGTDEIINWFKLNIDNTNILEDLNNPEIVNNPIFIDEDSEFSIQPYGVLGCISAVTVALIGLAWAPSKILKVKSAIKALGGTSKFVKTAINYYKNYRKLGYTKTYAWERAVKGASATTAPELKSALLQFFGVTAIVSVCVE
ncbi:hypothetical protein ACFVR2_19670 [Gottfriedia sp. NPDC057991]|uniref:hypothetical protein n=1 Tax=Gottfriedia sp. NPDC057991 TaxID=3346298 RepID=UPI0036DCC164